MRRVERRAGLVRVEFTRCSPHVYERLLEKRLRSSARSALVVGPRQVGKSTLLAKLDPDFTLNLAEPATHRPYVARPELLAEELAAAPKTTRLVLIDEVQKVPPLLDAIQAILDASPRRFRFLLSGSSARKLRRGQANLLPGRVIVHAMHPLRAGHRGEGGAPCGTARLNRAARCSHGRWSAPSKVQPDGIWTRATGRVMSHDTEAVPTFI